MNNDTQKTDVIFPLEHKLVIIEQEIEKFSNSYARHYTYLTTLRGYSLTLTLAFLGFLITVQPQNISSLVPFSFALLLFIFLEAGETLAMGYLGSEIYNAEAMFMETDPEKFIAIIQAYSFRSIRQSRESKPTILQSVGRRVNSISKHNILWHLSLFIVVLLTFVVIQLAVL